MSATMLAHEGLYVYVCVCASACEREALCLQNISLFFHTVREKAPAHPPPRVSATWSPWSQLTPLDDEACGHSTLAPPNLAYSGESWMCQAPTPWS